MNEKTYYYIDESGDLAIFDKHKKYLNLSLNGVTPLFYLGLIKIKNVDLLNKNLNDLRKSISENELYKHIKNLQESLNFFHAKNDMYPIRIQFFELLKQTDFSAHIIFRRKVVMQNTLSINFSTKEEYHKMISRLLRDRLHKSDNTIVFAKRTNTITNNSIQEAVIKAKNNFYKRYEKNSVYKTDCFIGEPANHSGLQVIDYVLWALNRFLINNEDGYLNVIQDKIKLIVDMDDSRKNGYGVYYSNIDKFKKEVLSPISDSARPK